MRSAIRRSKSARSCSSACASGRSIRATNLNRQRQSRILVRAELALISSSYFASSLILLSPIEQYHVAYSWLLAYCSMTLGCCYVTALCKLRSLCLRRSQAFAHPLMIIFFFFVFFVSQCNVLLLGGTGVLLIRRVTETRFHLTYYLSQISAA